MIKTLRYFLLFFTLALSSVGCKPDVVTSSSNNLTIWLEEEPTDLNPVTSIDAGVYLSNIIPSLVNFDPKTLAFSPVLLDTLPSRIVLDTGQYKGMVAYEFHLLEQASWPDGSMVTTNDYIFSIKVAFNKQIVNNRWNRPLSFIKDVLSIDSKMFLVVVEKDRPRMQGYIGGFELLPEYVYDPKYLLKKYPLQNFIDNTLFDKMWTDSPEIQEFVTQFSGESHHRSPSGVKGAGPYNVAEWKANQQIVLVKKKNYWGDAVKDKSIFLVGYPDTITYVLIKEELTAISELKNRHLDLVPNLTPEKFIELREDVDLAKDFQFFTANTKNSYMIAINNRKKKLNASVRQALGLSIDVDELIKTVSNGLAKRVIGPLGITSPYYHHELSTTKVDLAKAKEILAADGWTDSDGDGVLEKEIDGKIQPLELEFWAATGTNYSKEIAPILKQSLAKVGVKLNIHVVAWGLMLKEVRSQHFDMALIGMAPPPSDYAPYQSWHSDNTGKNGRNLTGYASSKVDSIIMSLNTATSTDEKKKLYFAFQEALEKDKPAIFLFTPQRPIIIHKHWKPYLTTMNPGYIPNAFQLIKE